MSWLLNFEECIRERPALVSDAGAPGTRKRSSRTNMLCHSVIGGREEEVPAEPHRNRLRCNTLKEKDVKRRISHDPCRVIDLGQSKAKKTLLFEIRTGGLDHLGDARMLDPDIRRAAERERCSQIWQSHHGQMQALRRVTCQAPAPPHPPFVSWRLCRRDPQSDAARPRSPCPSRDPSAAPLPPPWARCVCVRATRAASSPT